MDPLVFTPYLRPTVWGRRQLGELLDKPLPAEGSWGESWEVSVHPTHVSRVAEGPLAGLSLTQLCQQHGRELFGSSFVKGQAFPLLVKFLDANDWLSVQVHPDDDKAPELAGETLGKTEAWVVLAAAPGSRIFAGLKRGVTRDHLEEAMLAGRVVECLNAFEPQPGDCLYLPAGTVHAVGGGVLIAEVQQSSDATLRLYDWGRLGADGNPRTLHIPQALAAIDWDVGPAEPRCPWPLPGLPGERLAACDYFCIDRYFLRQDLACPYPGQLSLWMVLDGTAELRAAGGYCRTFARGGVVMVPAASDAWWRADSAAMLLGVTLPQMDLGDFIPQRLTA